MGQQDNWKMTPLDTLLCSNQLQILKSLVFFFPPIRQRQMIFLVKLMELRQCLTLPLSPLTAHTGPSRQTDSGQEIFEHIFPYCDQEKQQMFQQMQQAFRMMNMVRQFSDSGMFDQFGEMMSTGNPPFASPGPDMTSPVNMENVSNMMNNGQLSSMFSSMMNPEQQALVSQYEAMLDDL